MATSPRDRTESGYLSSNSEIEKRKSVAGLHRVDNPAENGQTDSDRDDAEDIESRRLRERSERRQDGGILDRGFHPQLPVKEQGSLLN